MTYAIIGSGRIGAAVVRQFARTGLDILIANKRGADSLADLVRELGPHVKPAPLADVLAADIVFLAVPYDAIGTVTAGVTDWKGRIVIDATNAIDYPAFTPRNLGGRPSSDIVAPP